MIKSATFKLTLWYLGIIMLLSILFSMALYRESAAQLGETVKQQRSAIVRLPLPAYLDAHRNEFLNNLDAKLKEDRQKIIWRLTFLNILTLILGGAASYVLARRTLRPIEDSLEAQSRFTADASHELRTPLTAMRAEIEVALRQKQLSAAEARELLGSNLEEIAKLEALSASLLRLAHTGGGLSADAISDVRAKDIFAEAVGRFEKLLADREISVVQNVGDETVAGDRASLVELLAILLDNAIKYSPAGSKIKLTSEPTGHFVRLSVSDQGEGIKPEDVDHIFERFYRADRARSKDQITGYGLGLSIAKRIVDLHHGTIAVDSTSGQGATFRIKLPVQYTEKAGIFG